MVRVNFTDFYETPPRRLSHDRLTSRRRFAIHHAQEH